MDAISAFIVNVQGSHDGFVNLFRVPAQWVCADQNEDLMERMEDHADELHVFFYNLFGEMKAAALCEFRVPVLRQRKLAALLAVLDA